VSRFGVFRKKFEIISLILSSLFSGKHCELKLKEQTEKKTKEKKEINYGYRLSSAILRLNEIGSVCRTYHSGALGQPLLLYKIIVTYSESVSAAIGIQHAMLMRHIVICGPPVFL